MMLNLRSTHFLQYSDCLLFYIFFLFLLKYVIKNLYNFLKYWYLYTQLSPKFLSLFVLLCIFLKRFVRYYYIILYLFDNLYLFFLFTLLFFLFFFFIFIYL